MAYLNEVKLIGNVGKDPEVRYMPNGDAVANFSLATTKKRKDKQTGEMKERTEWHSLVAYKGLAEIVGQYVKKGHPLFVSGELRTRKWQDKEGQDRYTTEIIIEDMQMLGGGRGQADAGAGNSPSTPATGGNGFEDDDIPFDSLPPASPAESAQQAGNKAEGSKGGTRKARAK